MKIGIPDLLGLNFCLAGRIGRCSNFRLHGGRNSLEYNSIIISILCISEKDEKFLCSFYEVLDYAKFNTFSIQINEKNNISRDNIF